MTVVFDNGIPAPCGDGPPGTKPRDPVGVPAPPVHQRDAPDMESRGIATVGPVHGRASRCTRRDNGRAYRATSAALKRTNADQDVASWIQLIVNYFCRPATQVGGIASGS